MHEHFLRTSFKFPTLQISPGCHKRKKEGKDVRNLDFALQPVRASLMEQLSLMIRVCILLPNTAKSLHRVVPH